MDFKEILLKLVSDSRYKTNAEFGEPRPRHPEGKVKNHIKQLEVNLTKIAHLLSEDEYWKLKFLIHIHDIFKAAAMKEGLPSLHPLSHATLAKSFAGEFTNDADILNMIQYHDENFFLWEQFKKSGQYDANQLYALMEKIKNWDLFLAFTIIDGCVPGKELEKVSWFIKEVKSYATTRVDQTWVDLIAEV